MDSITHIVLGATMGQAMAGKKLNRMAMVWGAVAQSLPDIDFIAAAWTDTATDLLVHRGITHSIFFALVISPLLAWLLTRWSKNSSMSFNGWMLFWLGGIFMHLFIDVFNAYGTALLAPFTDQRFSLNALFVADPLFTIWPLISTIAILITWKNLLWRSRWSIFGVGLCGLYLAFAVGVKWRIMQEVKRSLIQSNIQSSSYFVTPTPMNTFLWYAIAADDKGYFIGYRSLFDNQKIQWQYVRRQDSLINDIQERQDVQKLQRFSQGYYSISKLPDTRVFSDLRFGQRGGWDNSKADFVFQYYLDRPDDNKVVIQRGRVGFWTRENLVSFGKRISGN